ncbi:MAG: lipoprotein insertase outer membrane protein LolB [Pseudomonadota bacterium]
MRSLTLLRGVRLLACCLVLAGCAGSGVRIAQDALRGQVPVEAFQLTGRVSVKREAQNLSGTLDWRRAGAVERLLVSGPLGQGAAEIQREAGTLVLRTADGVEVREANDAQMLERLLGVALPLDGLVWWLSALPRPGGDFQAIAGEDGRIARLDQDGWQIEYSRYREVAGRWLPGRVFASRGDLEFRLVVDVWEPL